MRAQPPIPIVMLHVLILPSLCWCRTQGAAETSYDEFLRLVQAGQTTAALEAGERLFQNLVVRKPDHAAVAALSRRLEATQQIGKVIADALKPSQTKLLEGVGGLDDLSLPPSAPRSRGVPAALPPSAQELYWTHLTAFTGDLTLTGLPAHEAAFLRQYYDLQMEASILKTGRQALVVDPNSAENACYALVLPLLYLSEKDTTWDRLGALLDLFLPRQLDVLWRFALLQAERPPAAADIARYQARRTGASFSLVEWAPVAAEVCTANHRPDLAEKSLDAAIRCVTDRDQVAQLRLKAVESYARCGNYMTAAQACQQIVHDLPDNSLYGRIMATYFGYLAREGKADQIVAETPSALTDGRCRPYLPQMLYLRWWALCKVNRQDEAVQVAQRLIEQHPDHPCVAPVLLERATDALARQQYDQCRALLTKLAQGFPGTESAKRAQGILARLQGNGRPPNQNDLPQGKTGTTFKGR